MKSTLQPKINKYIPVLHPKQTACALLPHSEGLFGGAAGGGKSAALLACALQYVDQPFYHALIIRRTYQQLSKPGALIDLSKEWLMKWREIDGTRWSGTEKKWTFPTGSTLTFGHLQHDNDIYNYQGAAYQFVAYDELTQFEEPQYLYLFSRRRKRVGHGVPTRFRAASNPGGVGHEWVKHRFIEGTSKQRFFLPAKLWDNPSLDAEDYVESLSNLDALTRAQLLAGDWDAYRGGRFHDDWFRYYSVLKDDVGRAGRHWFELHSPVYKRFMVERCPVVTVVDPAASEKNTADYTCILTAAVTDDGDIIILDVVREHLDVNDIPHRIAEVCGLFQPMWVGIEDVAFQLGIIRACQRRGDIPTIKRLKPEGKDKLTRATSAIIRFEQGEIYLPYPDMCPWVRDFISELVTFTGDPDLDGKVDQVDAIAYLVQTLDRYGYLRKLGLWSPQPQKVKAGFYDEVEPNEDVLEKTTEFKDPDADEPDNTYGGQFGWEGHGDPMDHYRWSRD